MQAARTPPHLATLIALTGASILALNMFVPSLAHMAQEFQVDYGVMSLALGGFLFMTAAAQLVFGPLSDRYGRRPLILFGMAVFIVASLVCTLSHDIHVFLVARMCQAASATGVALSRAILRDQYEGREMAAKMATVSMVMAVAPLVGPALGGLIDEAVGWRGTFALYTVIGVVLLALSWGDLGETNVTRSGSFSAQFRAYPELLTSPRFWGYTLCWSFSVATFHIFVAGAPLAASAAFGMSPAVLGVCMGTMTLGYMSGSWCSRRAAQRTRWPLTTMMALGRIVATLGFAMAVAVFLSGHVGATAFFAAAVLSGLGNGLTSPNAASGVMAVRPHLAGSASGLSSAMIMLVGAIGATLTGLLVSAENGVVVLPLILMITSLLGLGAALWVRALEARRAPLPPDGAA